MAHEKQRAPHPGLLVEDDPNTRDRLAAAIAAHPTLARARAGAPRANPSLAPPPPARFSRDVPDSLTARGPGSLDDVLPRRFFQRVDESDDAEFYAAPRFVTHVDDATIAALTEAYRDLVPPGARVLDLMSSWVSHLPPDVAYARVVGHGMSAAELARNERLDDRLVRDLNRDPELPLADASLDAALCAFSAQYLTRPLAVFASVRRILAPGGRFVVAISHRMFPTKAIAIWHPLDMADRARLVGAYFRLAGGWSEPRVEDRSPVGADPLLLVWATRA